MRRPQRHSPEFESPPAPITVDSKDIFCLVVRLSGYFTLFFAAYTMLGMVLGPVDLGFKPFMVTAAYGALGFVLMKMGPVVGEIAYGNDSQ